ncbi:MAG: tetratricopeptide repeat protein [Deltaproteobacteria bacterium]|nr:tetratricopeptide repeat protein [Deltaproteobacteria bacterium]
MSYIHEALKKAQVERDLGKGSYGGIPVPRRKKSFFTTQKTIFSATVLLLVLLAFAGYSWWDLKGVKWEGDKPSIQRKNPSDTQRTSQTREDRAGKQQRPRVSLSQSESVGKPFPAAATHPPVKSRSDIVENYQKARAFHRDGRLTDAGMWYDKVIIMDPGHVRALNNRGVLHLHHKDYPAARKCFEKAIRLKPDYVDPYYNLACVSVAQGQSEQGLRYLKKAVSMDPAVRVWAKEDPDLDVLRGTAGFKKLVTNEESK